MLWVIIFKRCLSEKENVLFYLFFFLCAVVVVSPISILFSGAWLEISRMRLENENMTMKHFGVGMKTLIASNFCPASCSTNIKARAAEDAKAVALVGSLAKKTIEY